MIENMRKPNQTEVETLKRFCREENKLIKKGFSTREESIQRIIRWLKGNRVEKAMEQYQRSFENTNK
jgi:hypothetical protein